MFLNFIEELIQKNKITIEEIEKLKTNEYSNNLFVKTYHPIILDKYQKRYRKNKLQFNLEKIYITTEFFE